jgi:hypothetical protein
MEVHNIPESSTKLMIASIFEKAIPGFKYVNIQIEDEGFCYIVSSDYKSLEGLLRFHSRQISAT